MRPRWKSRPKGLEYFNGHSPNGQFYRDKVDYFGIGAHLYY